MHFPPKTSNAKNDVKKHVNTPVRVFTHAFPTEEHYRQKWREQTRQHIIGSFDTCISHWRLLTPKIPSKWSQKARQHTIESSATRISHRRPLTPKMMSKRRKNIPQLTIESFRTCTSHRRPFPPEDKSPWKRAGRALRLVHYIIQ